MAPISSSSPIRAVDNANILNIASVIQSYVNGCVYKDGRISFSIHIIMATVSYFSCVGIVFNCTPSACQGRISLHARMALFPILYFMNHYFRSIPSLCTCDGSLAVYRVYVEGGESLVTDATTIPSLTECAISNNR